MVEKTVLSVVKKYLKELSIKGIPVTAGVIFGSYARGRPHEWSDIDLLVVSPRFDKKFKRKDIDLLWHVAADVDSRIEPIAVGERQYKESRSSYIIAEARRGGLLVPFGK